MASETYIQNITEEEHLASAKQHQAAIEALLATSMPSVALHQILLPRMVQHLQQV